LVLINLLIASVNEYYEILGLKPDASLSEIKVARAEMLEVWHPDRFQHKPSLALKATEKCKEINIAYENLLKHKKTEEFSQTKSKTSQSYTHRSDPHPKTGSEHSEYERQQENKKKQEAQKTQERERFAQKKFDFEIQQTGGKKSRKLIVLTSFSILIIIFGFGLNSFIKTDYAKDLYAWWNDPDYYTPRLTSDWVRKDVRGHNFIDISPIDPGAKIEWRYNGYPNTSIITKRVYFFKAMGFASHDDPKKDFIYIRAADAESVGKRYSFRLPNPP